MCAIHTLCKTGTVCLRVVVLNFISDLICVHTFLTHVCRLFPEDLALALKQVLSLFPVPLLHPILCGGYM